MDDCARFVLCLLDFDVDSQWTDNRHEAFDREARSLAMEDSRDIGLADVGALSSFGLVESHPCDGIVEYVHQLRFQLAFLGIWQS